MNLRAVRGSRLPVLITVLASLASAAPWGSDLPAYEHQTWRTENGLPQNSVHSIVQTGDGYIWLGTEGGVARFDGLRFVVFDSENTAELRSNNIRCLLAANNNSLWIATADGLTRLQNGKFTVFTTEKGLPSNNVLSLRQDGRGTLWAITTDGSAVYEDGRFTRKSRTAPDGNAVSKRLSIGPNVPWLLNRKVTTFMQDRAGVIWVGTETGAARIVGDKLYPIGSPNSISDGLILSFFEDRDGDVWMGTDSGGVTVFRDQRFRKFGRDKGMPDDLVRCIYEDSLGTLWAGTNGHGLKRFNGQTFSSFTTAEGLSSDVILSLAGDSHGVLFVGTPDGLNIIREGHVQLVTSADGLPDDFVRSIYVDRDGSLWMGTRRGLAHYSGGRVTTYTTADGLPSDLVGAILRGKNGGLWIGTLKGLTCIRDGKVNRLTSIAGGPDVPITSLFEDERGVLWIGTETGGLRRHANQHAFAFPSALGLPRTVSGLVEDANGQLWITSPHGLFRASIRELNAYADRTSETVSVISYGTGDGLTVNDFSTGGHPATWKDRRNAIWFASAKGIVSIDAQHTAANRIAPSVVFERVTADDRILDPRKATTFGPGLSRISFEYTGLSFAAPQQIRFKYRMEGFDKRWIDAGTRRTAYYTNLPPGGYRFVVLARNNDGIWNTRDASLAFQLQPHFYQTNWFRGLLLLTAAMAAYAFYRWRVHHVRMQFNVVMAERNRIAREIHDTLAQGFVAVAVQLELVRRLMSTSLESASEVLQQAQALVQESLGEARRSIWNLRAEQGSGGDLPSKLSKTLRQLVQNNALQFRLEVTGTYRPVPARIESEVLRIGQEAVVNAVRHAHATRLDVSLAFDSTKAHMTICDDGQGFTLDDDTAASNGHFGLRGMRERAAAINGKLSVTTAAGEGTQVSLEFPFR
jgi:ligand-binding sensor domain-containing protein/signal transduction histidine kinase